VEVAPGIAVIIGFGGNIGVSYGEDGTLLVDDQVPQVFAQVQQSIAALGADPARFVVDTHWHWDHALANADFGKAGATIVAHENVRPRLIAGGTVMGTETAPAAPEALPVITFSDGLTFHLNGDVLDVIHTGGGHTDGDAIVRWRNANVVHMGDMFMHDLGWPFPDVESGGNIDNLLASLEQAIAMMDDETIVIPGHGQLATRADVIAFHDVVKSATDRIKALKAGGATLQEALEANPVADMVDTSGAFVSDDMFLELVWASLEAS
jgi:glyoxylase-like metal-dependent hydrolase (beta-lactamase superfamily II)